MTFDPSKPVQTRDGQKARILCTDYEGHNASIIAVVRVGAGREVAHTYMPDGKWMHDAPEHRMDLVNIPESKWMNLYQTEGGFPTALQFWRSSREQADEVSTEGCEQRVAVVEWTAAGEFIITKVDK